MTSITTSDRSGEAGVTLVEILIVLVIISILMGGAVLTYGSAKFGSLSRQTTSLAVTYGDVIDAFADDHRNRIPNATEFNPPSGPLRPSSKPYLRGGVPEDITDGTIDVALSAPDATATSRGWVQYIPDPGGLAYWVIAYARESVSASVPFRPICYVSNSRTQPAGGLPRATNPDRPLPPC